MGMHIEQHGSGATKLVDDQSGLNMGYMDANSRLLSVIRFSLTRTTFGTQVGLLPAGAVPTSLKIFGAAVSNSTTTATIVIGVDTTSNYFLGGWDVKQVANGSGQLNPQQAANLNAGLASPGPLPGGYHPVTAAYAETATSTTGGPWYIEIGFYQPIPA